MNDSLQTIVAELMQIDPAQLGPDRALSGGRLQGSLGRSLLDAALRRRLDVRSPACYTAKTFGELEAAISGKPTPAAADAPPVARTAAPAPSMRDTQSNTCGVDMELVESLPVTTDFWGHEFYSTHFTPGEIAYCLAQEGPLPHFAARWCAKEAIKKCEPSLAAEDMRNLEVVSHADGTPSLRHHANGASTDLPHALSLSHTAQAAVAVVVRTASSPPGTPSAAPVPVPQPQAAGTLSLLTLACSLLAIALATAALVIAFRR